MKILLVSQTYKDSFPPRGLSMGSAVKQAENLALKHQVLVITCGRTQQIEKPNNRLTIRSYSGWLLPDPINYVVSFPLLIGFIKQVRQFDPDVVMVSKFMFFNSFVIPLSRLMGKKVITTTDTFPGINWFPRSKLIGVVMSIYARLVGLPLLWMSNKVVLLHQGLELVAKRYRLNYQVIPNGVESKLLGRLPKPVDIIKPKGEFWVGYVGRAESVKGYDIALKVADRIEGRHGHIKFVFVGGNQKQTTGGNKIFLGFRSDIYNIYQLFDVLILPSFSEGLPNVVMEAMAQGVVCVASNVGGVSAVITPNEDGVLVPVGNVSAIATAVLGLDHNRHKLYKLSKSARVKVKSRFNWEQIIATYDNLFTDVTG